SKAELLRGPGPEVCDHHLGAVDQLPHPLDVGRLVEVEMDAALAAVVVDVERGEAPYHRRNELLRVASGCLLDLDHVRSHRGQQRGSERADAEDRPVDDANAAERSWMNGRGHQRDPTPSGDSSAGARYSKPSG